MTDSQIIENRLQPLLGRPISVDDIATAPVREALRQAGIPSVYCIIAYGDHAWVILTQDNFPWEQAKIKDVEDQYFKIMRNLSGISFVVELGTADYQVVVETIANSQKLAPYEHRLPAEIREAISPFMPKHGR